MAKTLRFFVSSPGDVGHERLIASRVIERLQLEFKGRVVLQALLWEDQPAPATTAFQDYIAVAIPPADADIVIGIFWKRLGSRLREGFETRPDGTAYESGTVHELETALRAWEEHGKPTVVVYRKTEEPLTSLRDAGRRETERQWEALEAYLRQWFFYPDGTFRAGFHEFETPEEFEKRLYVHIRKLVVDQLHADAIGEAPAWDRGSPFRGLRTFEYDDAAVFFGRTRAVSEIRERFLQQARRGTAFVLVHGMSGSGKSSVMRAGVIPTLTHPGVIEGIGLWRRCIFRPAAADEDPCAALARRLMAPDVLPELAEAGVTEDRLARLFERSPEDAALPLRVALSLAARAQKERQKQAVEPEPRLFLLIDQMEELFSQSEDGTAERFMRLLAALATAQEGDVEGGCFVWIGATMRSDFLHQSGSLPGLETLLGEFGEYRLTPPNASEIGEIIRLSARAAGLQFERQDDPMGNGLDSVIEDATLSNPAALPLLEFVLEELYKRRSGDMLIFAAYRELGGLEGALGQRAEEVFQSLPETVQATLPTVLRLLANPAQGAEERPTARTVSLGQFAAGSSERALIDALIDPSARLLAVEGDGDGARMRVAHEALFSHWPRAQKQLAADWDRHRALVRVEAARAEWEARERSDDFLLPPGGPLVEAMDLLKAWPESVHDRDAKYVALSEQRDQQVRGKRLRRARAVAIAMSLLALVAVGVGIVALDRQRIATENQRLAVEILQKMVIDVAGRLETAEGVPVTLREEILESVEVSLAKQETMYDSAGPELRRHLALAMVALSRAYAALGRSSDALAGARRAQHIMKELVAGSEKADWRADLATAEVNLGDALIAGQNLAGAEKAYDRARAIREAMRAEYPDRLDWRQALATTYERIGDIVRRQGRFADARTAYQQSRAEREALIEKDPDNPGWRRDLSISDERIGDLSVAQGNLEGAMDAYKASLATRESLLDAESTNTKARLDVVVAHNKIGDVLRLQDKPGQAEQSYRKALGLIEYLVDQDRNNAAWKRELAVSLYRVADAALAQKRLREARSAAIRGIQIAKELHDQDAENATWRRDLAMLWLKLGDVHAAGDRIENAMAAYWKSHDISGDEAAMSVEDAAWRRDLAIGYQRLGDMLRAKGRLADALPRYREAERIAMQLVALSPDRPDWRGDLALIRYKLALALQEDDAAADALKTVAAAVETGHELVTLRPDNMQWRSNLAAALNLQAWLLATGENGITPEPGKAMALAQEAVLLSGGDNAAYVDTLAMAHFANGATYKAIELAENALSACQEEKSETDDVSACQEIASHLRRFRAHQAAVRQ